MTKQTESILQMAIVIASLVLIVCGAIVVVVGLKMTKIKEREAEAKISLYERQEEEVGRPVEIINRYVHEP